MASSAYSPMSTHYLITAFFSVLIVITIVLLIIESPVYTPPQHQAHVQYYLPPIRTNRQGDSNASYYDTPQLIETTPCPAAPSCPAEPSCPACAAAAPSSEHQLAAASQTTVDRRTCGHTLCTTSHSQSWYTFPHYNLSQQYNIPSSNVYVTSIPNHGAGLGHQFGEWLYGPYIAYNLSLNYMFTPYTYNAARWTKYLGVGDGEDTEDDLRLMTNSDKLVKKYALKPEHLEGSNPYSHKVEQWLYDTLGDIEQKFAVGEYTQQHTILLELNEIHVPNVNYACHPQMNLMLRQKYCIARAKRPMRDDFYAADQEQGNLVVAIHMRCGDSCFDPYRSTPFSAIVNTIQGLSAALEPEYGRKVSYHLYSQPPQNMTAEEHFQPLLTHPVLQQQNVVTHFHASSVSTLHHLATADVLVGGQSSFSWVGGVLHSAVTLGPMSVCKFSVQYNKDTGAFDQQEFLKELHASRDYVPRYGTIEDCARMKALEPM